MTHHYQHTKEDLLTAFPKANGAFSIKMPVWGLGLELAFVGGPFVKNNPQMFHGTLGICLVENIPTGVNFDGYHLPIPDFSVPEDPVEDVAHVVQAAIISAMLGKEVFVGCLGGWGRTGIILSLIAKFLGIPKPVEYIREHYTPRAVETTEQYRYVTDFPVPDTRMWFLKYALAMRVQMLWSDKALSYDIQADVEKMTSPRLDGLSWEERQQQFMGGFGDEVWD